MELLLVSAGLRPRKLPNTGQGLHCPVSELAAWRCRAAVHCQSQGFQKAAESASCGWHKAEAREGRLPCKAVLGGDEGQVWRGWVRTLLQDGKLFPDHT